MNDNIDINILRTIYSKCANKLGNKDMYFTDFLASLEKISLLYYYNNELLITSFDKMEALYNYLNVDDILIL